MVSATDAGGLGADVGPGADACADPSPSEGVASSTSAGGSVAISVYGLIRNTMDEDWENVMLR